MYPSPSRTHNPTNTPFTILPLPALPSALHSTLASGLAFLHASCILTDHTLATFLPPLSHAQISAWWQSRIAETTTNPPSLCIWVVLAPLSSRMTGDAPTKPIVEAAFTDATYPSFRLPPTDCLSSEAEAEAEAAEAGAQAQVQLEVAGTITLTLPATQTGPFRASIEKFFVSPLHRRRGFARMLMRTLEDEAWARGRWNLLLDTEVGSDAEMVYPRLGFKRGMVVERNGYSPKDGREVDEVLFWKDLRWERGQEGVVHRNGVESAVVEL